MKKGKYFIFLLLLQFHFAAAQQDTTQSFSDPDFYDMTLKQLMNIEVSVASGQSLTTRESPGIVTLITSEEIKSSGARDLMDILKVVPGFTFCVDVEGVVGLAVRGNWAHEGKALLLIDGLEMNENLYSTLQFGNHYPIDNIKKIEIIRGPGSAMYGGNAEYAVINIITKLPEEVNGLDVVVDYGQMKTVPGQYAASISAGEQYNNFGYTISMFTGKAIRSDKQYSDLFGSSYDMADHSDLHNTHINLGMKYKKLQFRGIIDNYTVDSKDNYDMVTMNTYPVKFDTYIGEVKQEIPLSPNLVITPFVNIKFQVPWKYYGDIYNEEVHLFYTLSSRYTGGFSTNWNPVSAINISGGSEYFYDNAIQQGDVKFVSTPNRYLGYNNTAVFAQASGKTKIVDITAGARYNYNDRFGDSFVPRLSLTKAFDRTHFKLLYSQAYRAPNTQNIDLNSDIKPEYTTVTELEAGVKLHSKVYLTLNLYDITTKNPIIYYYDNATDQDAYVNASKTGTKGVELALQWKYCCGYIHLNYGFYTAAGKNSLLENAVPQNSDALLGIPNHKLTLASSFFIGKNYSINPTLIVAGCKYGVTGIVNDVPVISKYNPVCMVNLSLRAEKVFIEGMSAGISLLNILDQDDTYMQPYDGGHAPLPGPSQELVVTLGYKFSKKENR